MMIDSIIFDIDGTLLDSRAQVRLAWSALVEELSGHPWEISDQDFTALFGRPMDYIAGKLFPEEPDEQERMRKANLCYAAENDWLWEHPGQLFPGVAETLAQLSRRWPLYIVSNCQTGYIQAALQPHGLLPLFRDWLCFGNTGAPKSVTMRRLAEQYHLSAPIYVGDTQGDEDACREAGIPFVYAAYGFGQAAHPDRTIARPSDLLTLCVGEEALCHG